MLFHRLKKLLAAPIIALALIANLLTPAALPVSSVTAPAVVTSIAAGAAMLSAAPSAQATDFTDYSENKLIDWFFRGQSFTAPTTIYVGLATAGCSDSSAGTEVTGGSYARVAVTSSLANWAGTQSAGSTTASTGTGGTTSNNAAITFPAPTANWGSVTHFFLSDASTSGNMFVCKALTVAKTVNNGDAAPAFAIGALTFQWDN